ncbi:MAG: hypothetical protein KA165_12565 [Saprospiraceae bacterium]|nr:hypothetical protein [Saprospiraceae bacterium]
MKNHVRNFLRFTWALTIFISCSKQIDPPESNDLGKTGLVFATEDQLKQLVLSSPLSLGNLPDRVDLSSQMPPVGDQKTQSSCTTWATAYAVGSYFKHLREFTNYVYNDNLLSPSYVYNQIVQGNCTGTYFFDNFNILINKGACSLEDLPYDDTSCEARNNSTHDALAAKNKLLKFEKVNKYDLFNLKSLLYSGLPIMIGVNVDASFDNLQPPYIWKNKGGAIRGGHSLVLVGYDDNMETGAFKVMNSWGNNWKDNGFLWIDYNFITTAIEGSEAYIAYPDNSGSNPNPQDQITISLTGDLNFGQVKVGQSQSKTLQIGCTGNKEVFVSGITCPNGYSGYFTGLIYPNETKNIQITFEPIQQISYNGTITVNSNATNGLSQISISGSGSAIDNTGSWQLMPGLATDIGIGADGSVWIVSNEASGTGFLIKKWNAGSWITVDGDAVRIAVDKQGNPWVINNLDQIYRRVNNSWQSVNVNAKDIGIGADGSVWIVTTDELGAGYTIKKWNGSGWTLASGEALRISVDHQGFPWVVNSYGSIYRLGYAGWILLPGHAKDIGVGADGTAWMISDEAFGSDFTIKRWNGMSWEKFDGQAVAIAVDNTGKPWVVNSAGEIYKRN